MEIHRNEPRANVVVLRPDGRLDRRGSRELDQATVDLIANGKEQIVLDLSDVSAIDSDGIRCLLRLARRLEAGDGNLFLCRMPDAVSEAFAVSTVSDDFAIVDDVPAALAALSPEHLRRSKTSRAAARLLGLRSRGRTAHADPDEARTAAIAADLLKPRSDEPAPTRPPKPELPEILAPKRRRPSEDRAADGVEPEGLGGKLADWFSKLKKPSS